MSTYLTPLSEEELLAAVNDPVAPLPRIAPVDLPTDAGDRSLEDVIFLGDYSLIVSALHQHRRDALFARRAKSDMGKAALLAAEHDDEKAMRHFQESELLHDVLLKGHCAAMDNSFASLRAKFRAEQDRRRAKLEKRRRPETAAEDEDAAEEPPRKRRRTKSPEEVAAGNARLQRV